MCPFYLLLSSRRKNVYAKIQNTRVKVAESRMGFSKGKWLWTIMLEAACPSPIVNLLMVSASLFFPVNLFLMLTVPKKKVCLYLLHNSLNLMILWSDIPEEIYSCYNPKLYYLQTALNQELQLSTSILFNLYCFQTKFKCRMNDKVWWQKEFLKTPVWLRFSVGIMEMMWKELCLKPICGNVSNIFMIKSLQTHPKIAITLI